MFDFGFTPEMAVTGLSLEARGVGGMKKTERDKESKKERQSKRKNIRKKKEKGRQKEKRKGGRKKG